MERKRAKREGGADNGGADSGGADSHSRGRAVAEVKLDGAGCSGGGDGSLWAQCGHGQAKEPVVFRGAAVHWPSAFWSPTLLATHQAFGRCNVKALFHRANERPASEADCITRETTLKQFAQWILQGDRSTPPPPPPARDVDAACRGGRVADAVKSEPEPSESDSKHKKCANLDNAAFWFGTEGAVTRCHYDTYGCNLAVQLDGTKRWTMFPPGVARGMYPTRLPFEESTVRSSVDVEAPDASAHPDFVALAAHAAQWVELGPGDVLFVPHGWWHHVRCTSTAISTNLWISHPADKRALLSEAMTQYVVACVSEQQPTWFCPTQSPVTPSQALALLGAALDANGVHLQHDRDSGDITEALLRRRIAEALINPSVIQDVVDGVLR
ncbi:hypothetical protein PTSG_04863 [Salpingoeca rosetta]|uniref:JmjC domain-containing protein n=1 Tax=Salpingoeca rosetta (strain ATCC 50818 / BSB-021) TaxID=946362 RepID=F2U8U8_SALR5|nr:uncharacterized protein PTSG_04863 [Salpingoeca rosetta]EGD73151.1 hypothetical protein PTSG_04863 [Salpingoeca rosetta]|eukprot:XP_004994182.1 hypothetical protein PTSG_04863 [Salpingoeca rosetta]